MPENVFGNDPDSGGDARKASWLEDYEGSDQPTEGAPDVEAEGSPAEPAAPEAAPEAQPDVPEPASTPKTVPAGGTLVELSAEEMEALRSAGVAIEGEDEPPVDQAAEGATSEELAAAAEQLYANKYKSVEDLEKGYRERSDMWRRALEAQRAESARAEQAEAERLQYEQALRSAIPLIEQAAQREQQIHAWAEQVRNETGYYPQGYQPPAPGQGPPAGLAPQDVQRLVEERLAAERASWAEQTQRQQEAAALEQTVMSFYSEHPEVEPYGALDTEITDAMAELDNAPAWAQIRNADGSYGVVVDPTDRGSLDVLYEAVQRPALLEVLKFRPDYFTSEAGLQLARRDAALIEGVPPTTTPTTATVPASRAGRRAGQRVPFAEDASGTLPQNQGPDLSDPWEAIKAVDAKPTDGRKRSVFME
jgi:hypothetical protein